MRKGFKTCYFFEDKKRKDYDVPDCVCVPRVGDDVKYFDAKYRVYSVMREPRDGFVFVYCKKVQDLSKDSEIIGPYY